MTLFLLSTAAGIPVTRKHSQRSTAALAFVLAAFLAMNMALFGFLVWRKQQVTLKTASSGQSFFRRWKACLDTYPAASMSDQLHVGTIRAAHMYP
jgi:hypothetical protein